jgi:hypothetical protein
MPYAVVMELELLRSIDLSFIKALYRNPQNAGA